MSGCASALVTAFIFERCTKHYTAQFSTIHPSQPNDYSAFLLNLLEGDENRRVSKFYLRRHMQTVLTLASSQTRRELINACSTFSQSQ